MRKLTRFLIIAVVATSCNTKKSDLEENNIKGKVWKIQVTIFEGEEKFGKYQIGEKDYDGHYLYIYNEIGNIIEHHTLDREGKSKSISKYIYNDDNLLEEISTFKDNKLKRKQVCSFDGKKLIEIRLFDEKGELENIYKYDYKKNVISKVKVLNKSGKMLNTFENDYKSGLLNSQTVKDSNNKVIRIEKFKRNKNKDIIEILLIYPQDSTEYKYTFDYEYDKKGNWTKKYIFNKDGKIENILVRDIIYHNESKVPKNENDFIGIWFVIDDNDWIELRKDKKYDFGYREKISESGIWEIDIKQQIITFRANDPDDSRKYKYEFEGNQLILFTIKGDEELRLEKR